MKYLKLYENIEHKFEIGDYVMCQDRIFGRDKKLIITLNKFLSENVGKIISYIPSDYPYAVEFYFEKLPEMLEDHFDEKKRRGFAEDEIVRKATPEEIDNLEMQKNAKKYNL